MPRKNLPKRRRETPYIAPMTPDVASTLYIACRDKRRFPTEKQALHAAETGELIDIQIELRVYWCPHCRGWHLTRAKGD